MSLPKPVSDTLVSAQADASPITEVTPNTFVINLQQAIFGLEAGVSGGTASLWQHEKNSRPLSPGKHLLTGMEFNRDDVQLILNQAQAIKQTPAFYRQALANKSLAMIFEKPSFRTRLSFSMAIQSLGGMAIESISTTRKQETPADMARVLNGYADFIMVRTHDDDTLADMAKHAAVPVINGLSALHHPCQIFADLLTLKEHFHALEGLTLAYVGDGNNILHSLMLLAPQLGITIHYCCPPRRQPDASLSALAQSRYPEQIKAFRHPSDAVRQVQAVYTDVWTSMGFEAGDEDEFAGFQVNETLMEMADAAAVFMHCMPMERGKEVSNTLPDSPSSVIFRQSENRLHVQKALLLYLASPD
ncbi:ornithine carbamoyltransferase [Legionella sp. MW5194]|uniref:ornithine carbamoyltransferase n=1 Tax=Legionella sp. MW5194 TaxID=2662448 RepID=UPI00193E9FD4|nr:ornithine carbamoyltransferase [Legionella sp. MW5194]QRN04669.1 ornithine carbamoyltransferase [Legionella sp. MW5194]